LGFKVGWFPEDHESFGRLLYSSSFGLPKREFFNRANASTGIEVTQKLYLNAAGIREEDAGL
jgi:hypothetical protein